MWYIVRLYTYVLSWKPCFFILGSSRDILRLGIWWIRYASILMQLPLKFSKSILTPHSWWYVFKGCLYPMFILRPFAGLRIMYPNTHHTLTHILIELRKKKEIPQIRLRGKFCDLGWCRTQWISLSETKMYRSFQRACHVRQRNRPLDGTAIQWFWSVYVTMETCEYKNNYKITKNMDMKP